MDLHAHARHNLRRYPFYLAGVECHAWMPVFFLFFSQRVSLSQVFWLEAVYYVSIVLLEVPSGYLSDRLGRRPTLIAAATLLLLAHLLFFSSSSFLALALAQVLLAAALAANSGTDTSFHLANLQALDKANEYDEREARLATLSFSVNACAALLGGALAILDLRFAYLASALGAALALMASLSFRAVPEHAPAEQPTTFAIALRDSARLLRHPRLAWLSLAVILATLVNHVPYELYQPYLATLGVTRWSPSTTPLLAGLHLAIAQALAALFARQSAQLARRIGTTSLTFAAIAAQVGLIAAMAALFSPIIAVLLLARSIPGALQLAPLRAAITPHVPPHHRATFLSLQSLAGRLAFALYLITLALFTPEDDLPRALSMSVMITVIALVVLAIHHLVTRPLTRS